MKCVAIGDMFVKEKDFKRVLEGSSLFESYTGKEWKADLNRTSTRRLIREIETKGSEVEPLPKEIEEVIIDADILFIHLCPISRDLIQRTKHLKYIVSARGGLENICVEAAKEKGIHIIHCPSHNAHAVAELTLALMLCETRNISRADRSLRSGVWRENYPNSGNIQELRSCKIGLIGFGTIARLLVELLKPFACTVYIHDPFVSEDQIRAADCIPVSKERLLKESDIVSLHGRIGPGDPPIIGEKELRQMKKTSYLINTARANLIDMEALYTALKDRQIGGAALDVFPQEPLNKEYPFLYLDNCTLTNHRGGDTVDSYIRSPEILLEQLEELISTGKTRYLV